METLRTSKGHLVETNLTDLEAHAELVGLIQAGNTNKFIESLAMAYNRRRNNRHVSWSSGQRAWAHKIVLDSKKPYQVDPDRQIDINGKPIVKMFETASAKLKFPKITFIIEGIRYKLSRCGIRSKYTGAVNVQVNGEWTGRIELDGKFTKGHHFSEMVITILTKMIKDPIAFVSEYGHRSGQCCFCNKKLTDGRSLELGYGPVCAKNYGLFWGKTETTKPNNPAPASSESVTSPPEPGVILSTTDFNWDVTTKEFYQEISSLSIMFAGSFGTVPKRFGLYNPNTGNTIQFALTHIDPRASGINIAGWNYQGINGYDDVKLLIIND